MSDGNKQSPENLMNSERFDDTRLALGSRTRALQESVRLQRMLSSVCLCAWILDCVSRVPCTQSKKVDRDVHTVLLNVRVLTRLYLLYACKGCEDWRQVEVFPVLHVAPTRFLFPICRLLYHPPTFSFLSLREFG